MYAFPQIVSLPVLSSFESGGTDWTMVGMVLGWMLIAALVGSALGVLREGTRTPRLVANRPLAEPKSIFTADEHVDIDHAHPHAA